MNVRTVAGSRRIHGSTSWCCGSGIEVVGLAPKLSNNPLRMLEDQLLLWRQYFNDTEIELVIRGGGVVDGHRRSAQWRDTVLPLHPVSATYRGQELMRQGLIRTHSAGHCTVPIRPYAKYPGIVTGRDQRCGRRSRGGTPSSGGPDRSRSTRPRNVNSGKGHDCYG